MIDHPLAPWILFNLFILAMLALDLGVAQRRPHAVSVREALIWSGVWITLALAFNVWIYYTRGADTGLRFLTGYVVEKSLSIDNIFVFIMIFRYFQVPARLQHKVLFWGILGALVMRAIFIMAGVALLHRFSWIVYVFGAFLVFTGIRMWTQHDKEVHPERNPVLGLIRRFMPVTKGFDSDRFFARQKRGLALTPLFVVLLVIESTDLIFALDSIPAILAITDDPFIVYSSNVFAILGLRSLYFALNGMMSVFRFLSYGLAAVLVFVGVKMILAHIQPIPIALALGVVAAILLTSVALSLAFPERTDPTAPA